LNRPEAVAFFKLGDLLRDLVVDPNAVDRERENDEKEVKPESPPGRRAAIEILQVFVDAVVPKRKVQPQGHDAEHQYQCRVAALDDGGCHLALRRLSFVP
jgi:hypothetical protein